MRTTMVTAAACLGLSFGAAQAAPILVDVEAAVYDLSESSANVDAAIAAISGLTAAATFDVTALDYPSGSNVLSSTDNISDMIGTDFASLTGADVKLETTVWVFSGFIRLAGGTQTFSVGSDDGFSLSIGGTEISRYSNPRSFHTTSVTTDVGAGLQSFMLVYYKNFGSTGVAFSVDGSTALAGEAVPTPGSLALMASGGLVMMGMQRKFKPKNVT